MLFWFNQISYTINIFANIYNIEVISSVMKSLLSYNCVVLQFLFRWTVQEFYYILGRINIIVLSLINSARIHSKVSIWSTHIFECERSKITRTSIDQLNYNTLSAIVFRCFHVHGYFQHAYSTALTCVKHTLGRRQCL